MPYHPPGPPKVLFCKVSGSPAPCTPGQRSLLLSSLSAWGLFCTHLSAAAIDVRTEFISPITGPGAPPPQHSCFARHLWALAEGRESESHIPQCPLAAPWSPGAHRSGFLLLQARTWAWQRHFRPGCAALLRVQFSTCFPQRSGKWGA